MTGIIRIDQFFLPPFSPLLSFLLSSSHSPNMRVIAPVLLLFLLESRDPSLFPCRVPLCAPLARSSFGGHSLSFVPPKVSSLSRCMLGSLTLLYRHACSSLTHPLFVLCATEVLTVDSGTARLEPSLALRHLRSHSHSSHLVSGPLPEYGSDNTSAVLSLRSHRALAHCSTAPPRRCRSTVRRCTSRASRAALTPLHQHTFASLPRVSSDRCNTHRVVANSSTRAPQHHRCRVAARLSEPFRRQGVALTTRS
jgi:hypothetical protein